MLYLLSMSERIVYVVQEVPGTASGIPKINIMGARKYGELKTLLPELSQIIFSPGPLIFKLRKHADFPFFSNSFSTASVC